MAGSSSIRGSGFRSPVAAECGALLLIFIIWLVLCRGILTHFFTRIYQTGTHVDAVGQLWMSWWSQKSIFDPNLSLFYCPLLNFPRGAAVFSYDVAYLHVLISGLLRPYLGAEGSLNAVFIAGLLCSLIGTYILLRQATSSRIFAACLSAIPLLHLFHEAHAGGRNEYPVHFIDVEIANFGYLTLAIALWWLLLKKGGIRRLIFTVLLAGLTVASQMYYGISLMIFFILALILTPLKIGPEFVSTPRAWKLTGVVLIAGLSIALPVLLPSFHELAGMGALRQVSPVPIEPELLYHLGYFSLLALIPLGLLAWACRRVDRKVVFWYVTAAVFTFLGVGEYWYPEGTAQPGVIMPFGILKKLIPFFWRISFPIRFGTMATVAMVVFLALGQRALIRRFSFLKKFRVPLMIVILLLANFCAGIISQSGSLIIPPLSPVKTDELPRPPDVFINIGRSQEEYVILDLLCGHKEYLSAYYQIFHQKAIAGNPLRPEELKKTGEYISDLSRLQRRLCENKQLPLPAASWLVERGVRYIVIYRSFSEEHEPGFLELFESRFGPPVYSSAVLRIYKLLPSAKIK